MDERVISDARAGISVAVCEPNGELRDELARMIAKKKPEARLGAFSSGDELLRSEEDFAIYFLDVQGADGLEVARELRARERGVAGSVIVFVTGYRDYMYADIGPNKNALGKFPTRLFIVFRCNYAALA